MTLMVIVSCCVLVLVVGAVLVAMNPSWLGKHSPGVINWATGAPTATSTQTPYVLPAPPLTTGPMYVLAQPARQ